MLLKRGPRRTRNVRFLDVYPVCLSLSEGCEACVLFCYYTDMGTRSGPLVAWAYY